MNMPYAYCHDCTKAVVTLVPQLWYKCDHNDIDIRMQQHRDNDFNIVRNQVGAWLCPNVECATEVEKRMGEFGYDIGRGNKAGNGANDDSRYVYILKKA